jgi:UDP-glucose 4-epimerase
MLDAVEGKRAALTVFGSDYATEDGTCVRDYVHVEDIARAHVLALDRRVESGVYNLGTSQGVSNREIIDAAQTATSQSVVIRVGEKRAGDPPVLTASADKFNRYTTEWRQHNLDSMISHAWAWYNK